VHDLAGSPRGTERMENFTSLAATVTFLLVAVLTTWLTRHV
jgi:hypothetical protein